MAKFRVYLERPVYEFTSVVVECDTEPDAIDKVMEMNPGDFEWDLGYDSGDHQVTDVVFITE